MELGYDYLYGYTHKGLKEIESALSWNEENLRSPRLNTVEGWGIPTEPPDSQNNLRQMRMMTTLSLTHSDGCVIYNTGKSNHDHIWYPFWDANLGRPIGAKAQTYQNIEGLFIREFTNGWAVYNRSGDPQTIKFPQFVDPVGKRRSAFRLHPSAARPRRRNIPQNQKPRRC